MQLTHDLLTHVGARLDARLQSNVEHPLALALSGGGDSMALLDVAAAWARRRGRRLLALTVDHGLSSESRRWTDFAARAAHQLGADFRALAWTDDKPTNGLPAAARAARHRLLAQAARAAGARVILMAHTADDVAEGDWMRAEGASLGRLAEWAPSPVWPQGRGLALLRPLLSVSRTELRAHLIERRLDWIDDPANADLRFARARARRALVGVPLSMVERPAPAAAPIETDAFGVIHASRRLSRRDLALTVVCASGGERPPRGAALQALSDRLTKDGAVTAVLCGARIEARGDAVILHRESGEFRRRPPALIDGVWDGRFEVTMPPGGRLAAAAGRVARLPRGDRARLAALPASLRPAMPVLIRNESDAPILAGADMGLRSLVADRLAMSQGRLSHEALLPHPSDGGTPYERLSWAAQDRRRAPVAADREIEKRNEPA